MPQALPSAENPVLELTGETEALERGLKFLESCGITVSEVGVEATQEWPA